MEKNVRDARVLPWLVRFASLTMSLSSCQVLFLLLAKAPAGAQILCPGRLDIEAGGRTSLLPYCGNHSLGEANPRILRALIVVHGANRNAEDYYLFALDAARSAHGADVATLIAAPQFLTSSDAAQYGAADDVLYWNDESWSYGGGSSNDAAEVSSFETLDRILEELSTGGRFPALKSIVIAGHSLGGNFVSRYAAANRMHDALTLGLGIAVKYVPANSTSYLYLNDERAAGDGFVVPAANVQAECPGFNAYPWGFEDGNKYVLNAGVGAIPGQFEERRVVYLLGGLDDSVFDRGCADALQGSNNLHKGQVYHRYLKHYYGDGLISQEAQIVPGVGHDAAGMFASEIGLVHLFNCDGTRGSPRAAMDIDADGSEAPLRVLLNAFASSTPPGTSVVSSYWDFGDGSVAEGETVEHSYGRPGRYVITLTVTNDLSCRATETRQVTASCASRDVSPWSSRDIGLVAFPGSASLEDAEESSCIRFCTGGRGLAVGEDEFHFLYQELECDGSITAQVSDGEGGSPRYQAGVLLREGLDPGAPGVALLLNRFPLGSSLELVWREVAGEAALSSRLATGTQPGLWLRLERRLGEAIAMSSADGLAWEELGRAPFKSSGSAVAGIAAAGLDMQPDEAFFPPSILLCHVSLTDCDAMFRRGDATTDGSLDLGDSVRVLEFLFLGSPSRLACKKAADTNDDGELDISDPILLLSHLFLGARPPASPYPDCGKDSSEDVLSCEVYPPCP